MDDEHEDVVPFLIRLNASVTEPTAFDTHHREEERPTATSGLVLGIRSAFEQMRLVPLCTFRISAWDVGQPLNQSGQTEA